MTNPKTPINPKGPAGVPDPMDASASESTPAIPAAAHAEASRAAGPSASVPTATVPTASVPVAGVATAPAAPMHPLFPGRMFISTVLDALDSKEAMTGELTGKYLQRAIMAGFFVGIFFTTFFAISATFTEGGAAMAIAGKVLASATFGWALVLIYYTNSELLTSNMMIISVGAYHKRIGWLHSLCLLGNLACGLVIAALLRASTITDGVIMDQMVAAAAAKTGYLTMGAAGVGDLFVRAILCNFCINIGMMMVYNGKLVNDFTKCVIMVVAVFVFAYLGLEHSIADSVLFLIVGLHGMVDPLAAVGVVMVVLLGNFVGGGLLIGVNFAVMNDRPHGSHDDGRSAGH